jgi:predicted RNA-binding Zn-ribbon protein involved in translation (DUF1610 family)
MEKEFKCVNYGNCANADNELILKETELEETDGKFLCPKCGRELELITRKQFNWKPLVIALVSVIVLFGVGFALFKSGIFDKKPLIETKLEWSAPEADAILGKVAELPSLAMSPEGLEVLFSSSDESVATVSDFGTVTPRAEGTAVITAAFPGSKALLPAEASYTLTVTKEPEPKTVQTGGPYSLGWGTYEGPRKNGVPHGIQGIVKVTKTYTIDLKNGKGESKRVYPGDRIVNCKFVNGTLVYGIIKYSTGEQEVINIGI